MIRLLFLVGMVFLAMLCATTVEFDGVMRGRSVRPVNFVQVQVGHRVMALGTHAFRPGRVYWRITVS